MNKWFVCIQTYKIGFYYKVTLAIVLKYDFQNLVFKIISVELNNNSMNDLVLFSYESY